MPSKSATQLTEFQPVTLTPLQSKAIKWIAGMKWAIAKREGTKDYLSAKVPANQLEVGMSIITRNGHLWAIEFIRMTHSTVEAKAKNDGKTHFFHFAMHEVVNVEAE